MEGGMDDGGNRLRTILQSCAKRLKKEIGMEPPRGVAFQGGISLPTTPLLPTLYTKPQAPRPSSLSSVKSCMRRSACDGPPLPLLPVWSPAMNRWVSASDNSSRRRESSSASSSKLPTPSSLREESRREKAAVWSERRDVGPAETAPPKGAPLRLRLTLPLPAGNAPMAAPKVSLNLDGGHGCEDDIDRGTSAAGCRDGDCRDGDGCRDGGLRWLYVLPPLPRLPPLTRGSGWCMGDDSVSASSRRTCSASCSCMHACNTGSISPCGLLGSFSVFKPS